jgi:hypothetical protein
VAHEKERPVLVITIGDYRWYVEQALDGMVAIVRELGDERANARPPLPGANSPYAILTHCLGVMEYWGGALVAGRTITRDRDAEFCAEGRVEELVGRTAEARRRLDADLELLDSSAPLRHPPLLAEDADSPMGRSQGGALVHLYEELAQHHGQMQLTRDLLVAGSSSDRG